MSRPVCTDASCDRSVVRYRDGAGYCLFHPDAQPPAIDPKTGRPIQTTLLKQPKRANDAGDITPLEDSVRAPADGTCTTPGCTRPWKHTGWHTRPWSSNGTSEPRRPGRRRNPLDQQEAARRYLDGEGLFPLAAELHVGVKTLREALAAQGVEVRKRGDIIGDRRGPAPRPIDPDECQRLYTSGLNTTQIARQLHVKSTRVQALLRELGVLRPPGGRPPGAAALNSVRLKLTQEESAAVRLRAAQLGEPINHYLRRLVLNDIANDTTSDGQVA